MTSPFLDLLIILTKSHNIYYFTYCIFLSIVCHLVLVTPFYFLTLDNYLYARTWLCPNNWYKLKKIWIAKLDRRKFFKIVQSASTHGVPHLTKGKNNTENLKNLLQSNMALNFRLDKHYLSFLSIPINN